MDDFCTLINDEFENDFGDIYAGDLELNKENEDSCKASLWGPSIELHDKKFTTELFVTFPFYINSRVIFCLSKHFYIGPKQIQKNLYVETFFVHFELSTKRNHVNLYQFECTIKPQYLFNRIILKIQGLM